MTQVYNETLSIKSDPNGDWRMIYVRCPTCGTVLGNKEPIYHDLLRQKGSLKMTRKEILDKLNLEICCRTRMLGHIDIANYVLQQPYYDHINDLPPPPDSNTLNSHEHFPSLDTNAKEYSPSQTAYSPSQTAYTPSQAAYTPSQAAYTPSYNDGLGSQQMYSPSSPTFQKEYSPTSPQYSPTSPQYSPTSPMLNYSPTSPTFSNYQTNTPDQGKAYDPLMPFSPMNVDDDNNFGDNLFGGDDDVKII